MKFFISFLLIITLTSSFTLAQSPSYIFRDDFNDGREELDSAWITIRETNSECYSLTDSPGYLVLKTRDNNLVGPFSPTFYAVPVKHSFFEASTEMKFTPTEDDNASLVVFRTNRRHFVFGKFFYKGQQRIWLIKSHIFPDERDLRRYMILAQKKLPTENVKSPVMLKVTMHDGKLAFYYAFEKDKWIKVEDNIDAAYLDVEPEHEAGTLVGLYTTAHVPHPRNKAYFNWFEYRGFDGIGNQ